MENGICRNDFCSKYKKISFQKFTEIINKDALNYKDLLFNENSNLKLEINDDDVYNKLSYAYTKSEKPTYHHRRIYSNNYNKKTSSYSNNDEGNFQEFFDVFDKKLDKNKFTAFKRNFTLTKVLENNLCILKNQFLNLNENLNGDIMKNIKENIKENKQENKPENKQENKDSVQTFSVDDFFNNADNFFNETENDNKDKNKEENSTQNEKNTKKQTNNQNSSTNELNEQSDLSSDPKIVKIENIRNINIYLETGVKEPLWYLYHELGKSSFGPLSSDEVVELYRKKKINGENLIRMLDIYAYKEDNLSEGEDVSKNKDNSNGLNDGLKYFKLKEIEKQSFIKKIRISELVKKAVKNRIGKK